MTIKEYIKRMNKLKSIGEDNEHSYRPNIITLLESLSKGLSVINEPKKTPHGAPDIKIYKKINPIGYIETKKLGINLESIESDEQIQRYICGFNNFILTNYLEFRWYTNGELRQVINIEESQQHDNFFIMFNLFFNLNNFQLTTEELAHIMADYSKLIRKETCKILISDKNKETELYGQYNLLQELLINDLSLEDFADMYAQTICYGLFTARYYCKDEFSMTSASNAIPKTNPFLRRMFHYVLSPDLNSNIRELIVHLVDLLKNLDLKTILNDFVNQSDIVIHFYQNFLEKYNPNLREQRGVYYTPDPIVKFIVNSVDKVLKKEFMLHKGLSDNKKIPTSNKDKLMHKVQILDPALGTGTFMFHIIENIYINIIEKNPGLWSDYLSHDLIPRLYGFEYLMAPYSVAHMKIGLLLEKLNYDFNQDQRINIFLTNTLNQADKYINDKHFKWITEEANAAKKIKDEAPVMVILGNPPYSIGKQETSSYIKVLLEDYKKDLNEKKLNLNDEYIKFMRWSQEKIEQNGFGILAFVTNHSFLEWITHRQMRKSLMNTFDKIYVLDLHGNINKKDKTIPDNDENVFGIKQGISINIFIKTSNKNKSNVYRFDIYGSKEDKFKFLKKNDIYTTNFDELDNVYQTTCLGDFRFFNSKSFNNIDEYCKFLSLDNIFEYYNGGVQTNRNDLFISLNKQTIEERFTDISVNGVTEYTKKKYPLHESTGWSPNKLNNFSFNKENISPYLFRPYDIRYIYYDKNVLGRPKYELMKHMLKPNISLLTLKQTVTGQPFNHVFVTNKINDRNILTSNNVSDKSFPLYIYQNNSKKINFKKDFISFIKTLYNTDLVSDYDNYYNSSNAILAEDVFNYVYAILNSEAFRSIYNELLKISFPRVYFTPNLENFKKLSNLGKELVNTHLMSEELTTDICYRVQGDNKITKIRFKKINNYNSQIWINNNQYFDEVPNVVLDFEIGKFNIVRSWINSRKNTTLTYEDILYFQQIVSSIKHSLVIKTKIDKVLTLEKVNS